MRWSKTSLLCLLFVTLYNSHSYLSSMQCHPDESSALLQLKTSLPYKPTTCSYLDKRSTWEASIDCCEWNGITCDEETGHVIGLDLYCSGLYGTITSNNTLFLLRHLRSLDLSFNDFNGSSIVPEFGHFKDLKHLILYEANFGGDVPLEISHLSKLVSLNLSDQSYGSNLRIGADTFKALTCNLTSLEELRLEGNDLSLVPLVYLMNLSSSLTSLDLSSCNLNGNLHDNIFRLRKLEMLFLQYNKGLLGTFPNSNWSCPLLEMIDLSSTGLSINFPHLIKGAIKLTHLSLIDSQFVSSFVPSCLVNLTLQSLYLSNSSLGGQIPLSFLNFERLVFLDLSHNNFTGKLPEIYNNSTQNLSPYDSLQAHNFPSSLVQLDLSNNLLNGTFPAWIYEIPNLFRLDMSFNAFSGKIGKFQTLRLNWLDLSYNSLIVTEEFVESSKLEQLSNLILSSNNQSLFSNYSVNISFPNLWYLDLSSCNIVSEFPNFLRLLNNIERVDLSNNKIHGSVPKWLWDIGKDSITFLNLSHNSLTYMDPLSWNKLEFLDLRFNEFSELVPISSAPLLRIFLASKNQFCGEIPTSFCNMTNLEVLDLSYNNMSGKIPSCLGTFNNGLSVLDLRSNRFHGDIHLAFPKNTPLRSLNLNGNQLEGQVPKSLLHCRNLEVLDLGNNLLNGKFPNWLESLPNLQVLILKSNKLHGSIPNPEAKFPFYSLRIMDLSSNEFTGVLPTKLFKNFIAMMSAQNVTMAYMGTEDYGDSNYHDSVMVTMKGSEIELVKILTIFTTIDFSKNNFIGEIPALIGKLNSLKGLNLSHNKLIGPIPTSLGNLSNLEWLDLSSNNLTGKIPSQLASGLYQLAFINVSNNRLVGQIPHGPQFNTFNNDSYSGNLGLCGYPLSKSCSPNHDHHDDDNDDDDTGDGSGWLDWKIVAMGYSCGLVIGISLGYIVFNSRKFDYWLAIRIGRTPQRRPKRNACF